MIQMMKAWLLRGVMPLPGAQCGGTGAAGQERALGVLPGPPGEHCPLLPSRSWARRPGQSMKKKKKESKALGKNRMSQVMLTQHILKELLGAPNPRGS